MAIAMTMATSRPSVVVVPEGDLTASRSVVVTFLLKDLEKFLDPYPKAGPRLHMLTVQTRLTCGLFCNRRRGLVLKCCMHQLLAKSSYSTYESTLREQNGSHFKNLNDRKIVPDSDPPSVKDVNLLYQFIDTSRKLVVLTGAGISTESGIPDYRSPNGAYSTGFKPITHQVRITGSTIIFFRLHHRAGSDPLELHGTVYSVVCLKCGNSINRDSFQDRVKALNPKWAAAIESLECGDPGSDKSFGMQQRPDADIEIDAKFWEEDFEIPNCQQCGGILKPDVVFFGDNVPKDRAEKAKETARECDGFLVIGSSVMTMSAFRIVRAAYEANAAVAVINIGKTRCDDFVSLKINARCGEILPRVLEMGCLAIPSIN
ncbi:hypothetical protein C4D60_Mb06t26880 [Musa balbisiana]|uniref:Deacetylase sirtuin-type domain-containing protein n=1 Tax=Musa balbisiana TaxID=52838 RepID=A0A4S8IR22_MUSBA|nr:hypothetical protein C4D60_Mb06t26880 [Musa balbisiana]